VVNYKILPAGAKRDPIVVWAYEDGSLGNFVAIRADTGIKLEDVANEAIRGSASACKGEFATVRGQSRYVRGSEVQKIDRVVQPAMM
jgi:hypothetical protein